MSFFEKKNIFEQHLLFRYTFSNENENFKLEMQTLACRDFPFQGADSHNQLFILTYACLNFLEMKSMKTCS